MSDGLTASPDFIGGANHPEASGTLTKNGAGTLNLVNNTYLGGLTIQAGVVNLPAFATFGSNGIRVDGGELRIDSPLGLGLTPTLVQGSSAGLVRVTNSMTLPGPFGGDIRLANADGIVVNFNGAPNSLEVLGPGLVVLGNSSPVGSDIRVRPGARLRVASTGRANNSSIVVEGGLLEATSPDIFGANTFQVSAGGRFVTNQTQLVPSQILLSNGTIEFTDPAQPLRLGSLPTIEASGINQISAAIVRLTSDRLFFRLQPGAVIKFSGSITGEGTMPVNEGTIELSGSLNAKGSFVIGINATQFTIEDVSWRLIRSVAAVSSEAALGPAGSTVVFNPLGGVNSSVRFDAPMTANRRFLITDIGGSGAGILDTNGHDVVITGEVADWTRRGSGPNGIIKGGLGTLTLAGSNTLSGSMTVAAGTLAVASMPAAPLIVQANAALAPGIGIGTLSLGQPLTMAGESIFQVEFNADNATLAAGTDYDTIVSNGVLDLSGATASSPVQLSFVGTGTFAPGDTLTIGTFNGGIVLPAGVQVDEVLQLTGNTAGLTTVQIVGNTLLVSAPDATPPTLTSVSSRKTHAD